jgi:ABC-type proline/glycine betaine transport system permease subunit
MGANLAIVTIVVVISIIIGLYLGGKLRRKR